MNTTHNQGHVEIIRAADKSIRVQTLAENGRMLSEDRHTTLANAMINIKAMLNCYGGTSVKIWDCSEGTDKAKWLILYHDGATQAVPDVQSGAVTGDVTPIGRSIL